MIKSVIPCDHNMDQVDTIYQNKMVLSKLYSTSHVSFIMDTWYLPNTWRNAAQVIPRPESKFLWKDCLYPSTSWGGVSYSDLQRNDPSLIDKASSQDRYPMTEEACDPVLHFSFKGWDAKIKTSAVWKIGWKTGQQWGRGCDYEIWPRSGSIAAVRLKRNSWHQINLG